MESDEIDLDRLNGQTKIGEEDKSRTYGASDLLLKKPSNRVVRKEMFQVKTSVLITALKQNKWGKAVIEIKGPNEDMSGDLAITNRDFNMLMDEFGNTPAKWIGKKVFVQSQYFPGSANASKGWTIEISLK